MPQGNRLEPINLVDFTGGLNLRRDQFQLADNESPDMLNVDVDPRGGFYTRKGWQRWNGADITAPANWKPRNAGVHNLSSNTQKVYVAANHTVWVAPESGVFTNLGIAANATPHQADLAAWGDTAYIASGAFNASHRVEATGTVTALTGTTWSEVDAPTHNTMPMAEFVEPHAGYLFVANISEDATLHPARIRWSHPNSPDCFRSLDYIDIDANGGKITGLVAFQDHLLIFKTNNLWALYGYDEDSWQLVRISANIGCPSNAAVARSETACYFFSASNRGGIYGYGGNGSPVYMSERIAPALESLFAYTDVYVSWAGRRLWVSVPWKMNTGAQDQPGSLLVFDPDIGEHGSWSMYRSEYGAVATVLDGSDVNAKYPLATFWSEQTAAMLTLDYLNEGYDVIMPVTDPLVPQPFDSHYRTRWMHAGAPDRLKSWRRPMFVCRRVPREAALMVEQYRDYDDTTVRRIGTVRIPAETGPIWSQQGFNDPSGQGFDWTEGGKADPSGRGADWGDTRRGAQLIRGNPMGHAAATQLRVSLSYNTPLERWGVDGIVVKIVQRRFRT